MSKRNSKNKITYNRPDPPFLRRIREQIGYQEGPDVNTKLQELEKSKEERESGSRGGEEPTYVLTENSNVSEAEAKHFIHSQTKDEEEKPQRILFKKPTKQTETNATNISVDSQNSSIQRDAIKTRPTTTTMTKKRSLTSNDDRDKKQKTEKSTNTRLLSFADDIDEDQEEKD